MLRSSVYSSIVSSSIAPTSLIAMTLTVTIGGGGGSITPLTCTRYHVDQFTEKESGRLMILPQTSARPLPASDHLYKNLKPPHAFLLQVK